MGEGERIALESRLRAAVLAGDEAAWRTWYDAYADEIGRYVRWRCGGAAYFAEDALQETWLTAVRRIDAFDPKAGSFRQWLGGLANNVIRNLVRKHQRATFRRCEWSPDEAASQVTVDDEKALRTAAALGELNPRYEQVLRAKYLEGRAVADIANTWGETPKAIESLLSRARVAFREAYQKSEATDG